MAFEQNQQLSRLVNPMGMQQGQFPTAGMGQQQNQFPSGMGQGGRIPGMQFQPYQQDQGWGSWFKNFLFGSPEGQMYEFPYTQNQYGAFNNLLNQGQQNMQNPYAGFEPLQQQIMSQFHNQILPGIASRFTSGTGGGLSSPSFTQQLGSGARGLAESLAAHKVNYGQQNRQFGLQQTQLGLTPQFQSSYVPRQSGFLENAGVAAAHGLGRAAGAYLGGGF